MNEYIVLIELLRKEICNTATDTTCSVSLSQQELASIYKLSKAQDLAHIVATQLQNTALEIDSDLKAKLVQAQQHAIYRYVNLNYELKQIYDVLEKSAIQHMPLKGAIIRSYYPSPELRTSCDIDILVHNEDLERAVSCLVSELGYKLERRNSHDVSLFSPTKVHLELHFDLIENNPQASSVLDDIWNTAKLDDNSKFRYIMTNEFFVAYHIAHMAEHFVFGGCGVRNFLDLWIAKNKMGYNDKIVQAMLHKCGLYEFANASIKLANIWFEGDTHDSITKEIENYVMDSGMYGTMENHIALSQPESSGKFRYILKRLFMPYSKLKRYYPKLEKYPILFPIYQIVRWFDFIFHKDKSRAFAELKYNNNVDREKKKRLTQLIKNLKLNT